MEELHFGEGNGHPHRQLTSIVHTDIREVAEQSPLEMIHLSANIPFEK